jgi:hypothetical protein
MFGNVVPIKTSPLISPSRLSPFSRPRIETGKKENQSRPPQASPSCIPMSPPASPTKRFIGPAVSPLLRPVRTATPAPNRTARADVVQNPFRMSFPELLSLSLSQHRPKQLNYIYVNYAAPT